MTDGCKWLRPQHVPDGYVHACWAYTLWLDPEFGVTWQQFFDKFVELGGDWFYGAWALSYSEPYFQESFPGRYPTGLCPVAERVQPQLIQLKTNYSDPVVVAKQAEALAKTIRYFG